VWTRKGPQLIEEVRTVSICSGLCITMCAGIVLLVGYREREEGTQITRFDDH